MNMHEKSGNKKNLIKPESKEIKANANHEKFMQIAINESLKAYKKGDVPVGAVIVLNNQVIAKAYNKKHKKNNPLYHSEIIAINKACKKVKDFRLTNATIYVTKEPCLMCMGAILSARIDTIVYGSSDLKYGAIDLATDNNFNHKCKIVKGVLEPETTNILTSFFKELREKKKNK